MRVMVTGSRDWTARSVIRAALSVHLPPGATLVHGDARGVDTIAAETASAMGNPVEAHPAQWETYGRRAGPIRNVAMLDSGIDRVLAFHKGASRGTAHAIDEATRRGIPIRVWSVDRDYTDLRVHDIVAALSEERER